MRIRKRKEMRKKEKNKMRKKIKKKHFCIFFIK